MGDEFLLLRLARWFEIAATTYSLYAKVGRCELYLCRGFSSVTL
jgi:hypothetical protein